MKRIVSYMSVFVLAFGNVLAESTELFPMSDITIGLSSKELAEKYPTGKVFVPKWNDDKTLTGGVVSYPISGNKFWDSLGVIIKDAKVDGLNYFKLNMEQENQKDLEDLEEDEEDIFATIDYSNVIKNIKPLFRQLVQELGSDFEKKVICRDIGEIDARCAMYAWTRENNVVVFIHTPVSLYKKGNMFGVQVSIVPTLDIFSSEMATDRLPEDTLLWTDAMGEEKRAFPNLWVYACVALCAFCTIAYFIRRKRQR